MAHLHLSSNNPKFGFIIRKNPSSGMVVRPLKQGRVFGWYSLNNTIFNCFFRDDDHEISYKKHRDEEWSYVNPTAHNSPEFVLDTISEFFAHVIKKDDPNDIDGFENSLVINMIVVKVKYLDIFKKYFKDISIQYTEICQNNFRIIFTSKKTLKELFSFAQLFFLFNALKSRHLDDAEVNKYIGYLSTIKAPFFIKYVFKINVLRDRSTFNDHKKALEANSFETIEFVHGFASDHRLRAVEKELGFNRTIIDFGAGEGRFVKVFAHKLKDGFKYYAIDKDQEVLDIVNRKYSAPNVVTDLVFPALKEDADCICSEMIEHCEKDESTAIIKNIVANEHVKKLIITSPNKDFNQFYFFEDEETRHEDHHFEMTKDEFVAWIEEIKGSRTARIIEIGDRVNGIGCSLGAILE